MSEKKDKKIKKNPDKKNNNVETIEYQKRKKERKKNNFNMKIFSIIMFFLFLIYILGYFIGFINREEINSTVILMGSIDLPAITKGLIIRDETIYIAEKQGEVNFLKGDLERVKNQELLVTISDKNINLDNQNNLVNIEKKIIELQDFRSDFSIAQKDARKINIQIKSIVDNEIFLYSSDNINNMYWIKNEINRKINLRNKILIEDNNIQDNNLSKNREDVLNEIYKNEHKIISNESGIISYSIDGFENQFNIENLDFIKKEDFDKKNNEINYIRNKEVNINDSILKIINSNTWYLVSYINNELILNKEENDIMYLYLETNNKYKKIETKIKKIEKNILESYIILEIEKNILDFIDTRFINFKTLESEIEGLKIPNSAVVEKTIIELPLDFVSTKDNLKFIMIKNLDGSIEERKIKIWKSTDENHLILIDENNINTNNIFVSYNNSNENYSIQDVTNLFGVYKINSGIAKFVEINLEKIPSDDKGYSILLPEKNKNLYIYDIVATNAKDAKDEERVYKK